MTDESLEELPELNPVEEPAADSRAAPPAADPAAASEEPQPTGAPDARPAAGGLPAPAFNPSADKEYYRFLFAGLVMFIGCLMPFGPEWNMNGYKTLGGAFGMLVAIGMIWTWWTAIQTARFSGKNLKWVGFTLVVFILQLMNVLRASDAPAVVAFVNDPSIPMPNPATWGAYFGDQFNLNDAAAQLRADNFIRAFGPGKIVLFVGALLAEVFMLMAVFGGAKTAKSQKAARQQAAAASRDRAKGKRR